jgi:hypothetical protein
MSGVFDFGGWDALKARQSYYDVPTGDKVDPQFLVRVNDSA